MIELYPFVLIVFSVFFVFHWLKSEFSSNKHIDLGFVFISVVAVYGFVPSVGFALAYSGVGEITESRMILGIDESAVSYIEWMHFIFLLGFSLSYFYFKKKSEFSFEQNFEAKAIRSSILRIAFFLYFIFMVLQGIWGADVGDDYISSYTVLRDAPLIVQQAFSVGAQIQFAFAIAAVVVVVASKPQQHLFVAFFLGLNALLVSLSGGGRTAAFLLFLAYIVSASIFVPSFSRIRIIVFGISALFLFMIAGVLREGVDDINYRNFFQTGEFTALFINAIDLREKLASGLSAEMRFALLFVDFFRLIPTQIAGDLKINPSTWYAGTFYSDYYDAGGGFAFGVLAECALGGGVFEAGFRGVLLGLLFSKLSNNLLSRNTSLINIYVYVWLVVMCYQCYRDTTFSLTSRAMYQLLPVAVVFHILRPKFRYFRHGRVL